MSKIHIHTNMFHMNAFLYLIYTTLSGGSLELYDLCFSDAPQNLPWQTNQPAYVLIGYKNVLIVILGVFTCGPASVKAVRQGEIFYGYDSKFIFAEVNGDRIHWTVDPEGNMKPIAIEHNVMGRFISTKAVSTISREDLTYAYKFQDGKWKTKEKKINIKIKRKHTHMPKTKTKKQNTCKVALKKGIPTYQIVYTFLAAGNECST